MTRGQTRQRRQRTLAMLTAVVVLTATAVATLSHRGSHTTNVASNGATAATANLEWKVVNTPETLGFDTTLTPGGTSAIYAVSTAPGVASTTDANPPATLYRSVDGIHWSAIAGPAGLTLGALSTAGNRVYDVGTGTSTAAVGGGSVPSSVAVAASSDGTSWQQSVLNLDMATILTKATSNGTESVNVAAGPAGVLATVTVNATLNLAKVLPAGAPTPSSWVATADGVELLQGTCPDVPTATGTSVSKAGGTAGTAASRAALQLKGGTVPPAEPAGDPVLCYSPAGTNPGPGPYRDVVSSAALGPVTASYTWAQLGVSGDTERAVLDEPFGFLSTNGTTFHPVTLPGSPGESQPQITAGPTGFGLVGANQATGVNAENDAFWQSTDGTNWVQAAPLPDPVSVYDIQMGVLAGRYAIVDEAAPSKLETLVGDTWNVTDLAQTAALPGSTVGQAAFGPLGVAIVMEDNTTQGLGANATVLYSPDGVTWSSRSLSAIAGSAVDDPSVVSVTASQIVVVAPSALAPGTIAVHPSLTLVGTPSANS